MRSRNLLILCALLVLPREVLAQLRAVPFVTGFSAPIAFIQDPSDAANQFVVQQDGRIRLVRSGVVQLADFLDIGQDITQGGEQGLLGMAVPADYATSGRFYLYFNDLGGDIVVARFKRDGENPLVADPGSRFDLRWSTGERVIRHPTNGNHNGGNIAFGPDGFLYIGTGDGGSGNDPANNAQNMLRLLGKMLRIDVSVADSDPDGFVVPSGNPFTGGSCTAGPACPEIWSVGLRNPWRWSFDDPSRGGTGALVIGDVGQGALEEIDYEPAGRGGRNYGWRLREGTLATSGVPPTTPAFLPLTDPIFSYGHSSGNSITGGRVYRGSAMPGYGGRYFFGDFGSGKIWSLALAVNGATGEATAFDLRDHQAALGSNGVSTFGVDANGELYFANYFAGTIYRIESTGPVLTLDKPALSFGAVVRDGALAHRTSAQTLRLTQSGSGTVTWTVTSNVPWLTVSPASGTGPAALTVALQYSASIAAGTNSGRLSFTFSGGDGPAAFDVRLDAFTGSTTSPFGSFDTPLDGAANLSGSIAVTGWALDDIEVIRVSIWRDALSGEVAQPGGLVFIGYATLVEGARPDVQGLLPLQPNNSRAGWGYLLLTNFLPNVGNGTFRLHAIAEDPDFHTTLLGTKTISVNNQDAIAPFGAIDTPSQGGVVSGVVTNFGWVLSRNPRRADPPGGSVQVLIDGAVASFVPSGWASRSDISALFPVAEYAGVTTAVGNAVFDSTTLTNGVHTIAWLVTDNEGNSAGIGSRYFTVANGSSSAVAPAIRAPLSAVRSPQSAPQPIWGRRGFDPYAAFESFEPGSDGVVAIEIPELGRVELWLGHGAAGELMTPGGRAPLPIGSHLDADSGRFTWNPGAGFVGTYDFVFNGRHVRIVVGGR